MRVLIVGRISLLQRNRNEPDRILFFRWHTLRHYLYRLAPEALSLRLVDGGAASDGEGFAATAAMDGDADGCGSELMRTKPLKFRDKPYQFAGMIDAVCDMAGIGYADNFTHKEIPFREFTYGTCNGLWRRLPDAVEILAVVNNVSGNGHFARLMDVFAKYGGTIRFLEVVNERFAAHLERQGFVRVGKRNYEK